MNYKKSVYTTLAMISQVGISIVVPILLCSYAGLWLEERYAFPFTLILIFVGLLAGIRNAFAMIKKIRQMTEDVDEKK